MVVIHFFSKLLILYVIAFHYVAGIVSSFTAPVLGLVGGPMGIVLPAIFGALIYLQDYLVDQRVAMIDADTDKIVQTYYDFIVVGAGSAGKKMF